ncbi:MAG TPA: glutathione S-transferase family protein [Caulobacteraceae bacterium]|nr:glutathione S-transferase family protein [Caulobacteraceae bacterium]
MILYSENNSPYCAIVRLAIYAKDLAIRIESPPGGLHSDAFQRISPTGTIPCLVLDDGSPLPESAVILAYLEDKYPDRRLGPAAAEDRARDLLIARLADARLLAPLVQMFHDLNDGVATAREFAVAQIEEGLALLEPLLPDALVASDSVWQADCVLAPVLFGIQGLLGAHLLAPHGKLAAYAQNAATKPAVGRVLGELAQAMAAQQGASQPA